MLMMGIQLSYFGYLWPQPGDRKRLMLLCPFAQDTECHSGRERISKLARCLVLIRLATAITSVLDRFNGANWAILDRDNQYRCREFPY